MRYELTRHGGPQMGLAKYNTSGSKRGGKGRKRNSMDTQSGSALARVAKGLGVVLLAAAAATGVMLLVSSQALGLGVMAQAGIMLASGLVIAAAGIMWKFPVVGTALGVGLGTVGINYLALSLGARSAGSALVSRVSQLVETTPAQGATASTSATAPAATAATSPGGWVTSTPAWPNGLPHSTRMGDFYNTVSAPYSAANYG